MMNARHKFAAAVAALTLYAGNADAVTLQATSTVPIIWGDFTVEYTDLDSDGLLSLNEVTAFSGVRFVGTFIVDTLTGVPDIPDIADGGSSSGVWQFGTFTANTTDFTYAEIPDVPTSPIPLPPALAFGLFGLGALTVLKRRRKS